MRREELRLTCDLCLDELGEEVPAEVRVRLLDDSGSVRALDLCFTHNGDVHPDELEKYARDYGTLLRAHITRKGKVWTEVHERQYERTVFHEPGGDWDGSYVGPVWCRVPITESQLCDRPLRNVAALKTHQFAKHGIRVARS